MQEIAQPQGVEIQVLIRHVDFKKSEGLRLDLVKLISSHQSFVGGRLIGRYRGAG